MVAEDHGCDTAGHPAPHWADVLLGADLGALVIVAAVMALWVVRDWSPHVAALAARAAWRSLRDHLERWRHGRH